MSKGGIALGPLVFVARTMAGNHITADVRGKGEPGSRPRCGTITITITEWADLEELAASLDDLEGLRNG